MAVRTDDLGCFVIDQVPIGSWTMRAALDEHPQIFERYPIFVSEGGGVVEVSVDLDYRIEVLSGVVSSPDGRPVANVPIECESATLHYSPAVYRTRTDDDGWYEFQVPLSAGSEHVNEYTLRLTRWVDDYEETGIVPPSSVSFEVRQSRTMSLRPVDAETGRVLDVAIAWHPGDLGIDELTAFFPLSFTPTAHGMVEVIIPAGDGWIEIHKYGYQDRRLPVGEGASSLGVVEMQRASER